MSNPKVFISYSHDSPEHANRILALSDRLRTDGIDCILDQYEPTPSEGWPRWMDKQIQNADYVLMICTEPYYKRVMGEEKPGIGRGVRWEGNLIYNHIYHNDTKNTKFIPVLFQDGIVKNIPTPLQVFTYYWIDTQEGYKDLYRHLTNQPRFQKPILGQIKQLSILQRQTDFFNLPEPTFFPCIHNLPLFNQTYHFGREEFLTQLHEIFIGDNAATLTQTITGLGGVGKTQIALAYAFKYKEKYQFIWWVRAENTTTCDLDYHDFARRMELCGPEADRKEIIAKIRDWQEKNGIWLFVYDNAMDYTILQEYLPRFSKGHILITTRNNFYNFGNILPVDVFTPGVAAEFLQFRTKQNEPEAGLVLGQELGGLPLALEQAAAYIEKNHLTLHGYLDLLKKYKLRLFSISKPPTNYNYTVATTWLISLEKVTEEATRQLLYLSAFLAPDRISKQLFQDGAKALPQPLSEAITDDIIFNEMLMELETYSLIQRDNDEFWSIHRLLQEVVRESLDPEHAGWAETVMNLLNQVYDFDYNQLTTWKKTGLIIPHMQAIVEVAVLIQIENERLGWLCIEIGNYLFYQGRYEEAEPLYKRALEIRERVQGLDHPDTTTSLNNLALLYTNQGRYEEAEPLYKQALEIRERVQGLDHPDTATSMNNLAYLFDIQGRYEEAEPFYKRALVIREEILGPYHPHTASSLNNLAFLYYNQGRYEEAEPLYKRALVIREGILGPYHPDMANSLNNLGLLYKEQERYEKVEPLFKRALEIREGVLGTNHPDTATSMNNLACLYNSQGRNEEAEPLYQRALEIRERVLGTDHPDTAGSLNNLAFLYDGQGRYEEAEPLFKRALEILTKVLGKEHPNTLFCLNNLIGFYQSHNQVAAAQELMMKFAK
ncbi:MAG TPA: tetratricopeptide repeat protein [Bacillota bacterium]|nr:tetratricopeptide repeat protein [Bacillota bacterium]